MRTCWKAPVPEQTATRSQCCRRHRKSLGVFYSLLHEAESGHRRLREDSSFVLLLIQIPRPVSLASRPWCIGLTGPLAKTHANVGRFIQKGFPGACSSHSLPRPSRCYLWEPLPVWAGHSHQVWAAMAFLPHYPALPAWGRDSHHRAHPEGLLVHHHQTSVPVSRPLQGMEGMQSQGRTGRGGGQRRGCPSRVLFCCPRRH